VGRYWGNELCVVVVIASRAPAAGRKFREAPVPPWSLSKTPGPIQSGLKPISVPLQSCRGGPRGRQLPRPSKREKAQESGRWQEGRLIPLLAHHSARPAQKHKGYSSGGASSVVGVIALLPCITRCFTEGVCRPRGATPGRGIKNLLLVRPYWGTMGRTEG
jgi:hypothetical protein